MRRVQSQVIWLLACMLVRGDPSLPKDAHVFDQGEEMTPEMLLQKCTTPPAQTNARLANRRNRWMSFRVRWGRPWEKVPAARQNHRADWRSCHPRRPHHQRLSAPVTHHAAALRAAPRHASPRHAAALRARWQQFKEDAPVWRWFQKNLPQCAATHDWLPARCAPVRCAGTQVHGCDVNMRG